MLGLTWLAEFWVDMASGVEVDMARVVGVDMSSMSGVTWLA